MTNIEALQAMSLEKLAEWLDEHGMFDNSPWSNWFNEKYCEKCEPITCKVTSANIGITPLFQEQEIDCSYCELESKCRFFDHLDNAPDTTDIIKMWLSDEVEE